MTQQALPDTMTLGDARAWLRSRIRDGERCPCCRQMAKIYKRKLYAAPARALVMLFRRAGREPAHITTLDRSLAGNGGDISKLRYWGLVEEEPAYRPDGGRAGWWRVTDLGQQWIEGEITVPQFVGVYDTSRIGKPFGTPVTIQQALGERFNLADLMSG